MDDTTQMIVLWIVCLIAVAISLFAMIDNSVRPPTFHCDDGQLMDQHGICHVEYQDIGDLL